MCQVEWTENWLKNMFIEKQSRIKRLKQSNVEGNIRDEEEILKLIKKF